MTIKRDGNECWEFSGFKLPNGYGRIKGNGRTLLLAHRLSYMVHKGDIPAGYVVMHTCDNPACVNPDHLIASTQKDNLIDAIKKGRNRQAKTIPAKQGEKHPLAKLTEQKVREIRSRKDEPRAILAKEFGTSPRYISSIISRTKWKYLS